MVIHFDFESGKASTTKIYTEKQDKSINQMNKSLVSDFNRFTHIEASETLSDENSIGFLAIRNDGYVQIGQISIDEDNLGLYYSSTKMQLDETIECLSHHPVKNLYVLLNDKRQVSVFDVSKGRQVVQYTIEEDLELKYLSVHPDGKLCALSGTGGQIHFLDLTSGEILITIDCQTVSIPLFIPF